MWNKPLTTSRRSSESSESAGELATRSVESSVVANIFDGLRQRRVLRFSPSRAEFSFPPEPGRCKDFYLTCIHSYTLSDH